MRYIPKRLLSGFRSSIYVKRIENASTQGVAFLDNIREMNIKYGLFETYDFSWRAFDYEQWYTFEYETTLCLTLSVGAVLLIVLVITADFAVTLLVALSVLMTDLFLFAIVHFWGLQLNFIVMLNIVVAVGISVDYSAHISYAYLTQPVPEELEKGTSDPMKIRHYKSSMAVRLMGSSVFHGGFSTFLAILVLSPGKTYVFKVFFRCWFVIILGGMANGFLLLPVMLSFFGPTHTIEDPLHDESEKTLDIKSQNKVHTGNQDTDEKSKDFETVRPTMKDPIVTDTIEPSLNPENDKGENLKSA